MHQQLLDVAAMRLVRRHVEAKLHGADDAIIEFSRDQDGLAARDQRDNFLEELRRVISAERQHETDRRAAGYAISEHIRKVTDRGSRRLRIENNYVGLAHAARSSCEATVESALSRYTIGTPVPSSRLRICSGVRRSSTMISARSELPCAEISTRSPRSTRGKISCTKYGSARATVSFRLSPPGGGTS